MLSSFDAPTDITGAASHRSWSDCRPFLRSIDGGARKLYFMPYDIRNVI